MPVFSPFIRYFDEVARQGSIRRAADRLNVAPSAVNRQILKLEDELGAPLFERLPRGLRLTAAGEILVESVRRWQRDYGRARAQLEELRGLRRGHVTLAVVEGVIAEFLPDVLARFNRAYPLVSFAANVHGSEGVLRRLRAGEVEIGILFNPPLSPAIRIAQATRFRLGAVVPPGHPLTRRRAIKLRDCAEFPAIVSAEAVSLRAVLDAALAKAQVRLKPVAESNSIAVMKALARRGVGVAYLTPIDIALEMGAGDLVSVPLQDAAIPASILSVCVAAERRLSPAAALLVEHFGDTLAQLGGQRMEAKDKAS
jgi:DNA-binding transcriptional LysR family regulator